MNQLKAYQFEAVLLEPPTKLAALIEQIILTARAALQRRSK